MTKRPTIRDVARRAAVSVVTVSRVMNDAPHIGAATRARVEQAIRALRYHPNANAQSIRTQVTRTVGFVLPDLTNMVNAAIAKAAEDTLGSAGYMTIVAASRFDTKRELELLDGMQRRRVDGIIMQLADQTAGAVHEALQRSSVPIVVIDRDLPFAIDTVVSDHYLAMRRATRYLIDLGHRCIALITARPTMRPGAERVRAFVDEMKAARIELDPGLIRSEAQSQVYGAEAAFDLMTRSNRPSAIIAGGNEILPGVLQALCSCQMQSPRDVSLVGADESEYSPLFTPPITMIARDFAQIGRIGADLLLTRMRGSAAPEPRRVVLSSELVIRESCATPRGA
jgi:LacI family transcriptional regulator